MDLEDGPAKKRLTPVDMLRSDLLCSPDEEDDGDLTLELLSSCPFLPPSIAVFVVGDAFLDFGSSERDGKEDFGDVGDAFLDFGSSDRDGKEDFEDECDRDPRESGDDDLELKLACPCLVFFVAVSTTGDV